MKLIKRLRKNAICCMPVRSKNSLLYIQHEILDAPENLYTLPAVGMPQKTSTPVDEVTEKYRKNSTPRSMYSRTVPAISCVPMKPVRTKATKGCQKKSNPVKGGKKIVVVPVKSSLDHLLPVDEAIIQPRVCDETCIVCALAKPELRSRHHCTAYRS